MAGVMSCAPRHASRRDGCVEETSSKRHQFASKRTFGAGDDVLSENALRALEIGDALKRKALERHKFRFSTAPKVVAAAGAPFFAEPAGLRPFLTLRSPLKEGELRRVNLFEPRWLAMRDAARGFICECSFLDARRGSIILYTLCPSFLDARSSTRVEEAFAGLTASAAARASSARAWRRSTR